MSETKYEVVIGLEVHAQLATVTKLFCGCLNRFGDTPNTNVCAVCLGLPGALPVLNQRAVELAARMGFAVDCTINPQSVFARKNYFYPDLPKGYQISQYDKPIAEHGCLDIATEDGVKRIRIQRIHMEEDAGKLLHDGFPDADERSGVDFNRSGTPLIEIVSEPDLASPSEAVAYAQKLRAIAQYTGASEADMEKGNLRCDGNISVRPVGETRLGQKVELKNLNSFRFLSEALSYEADRQVKALEAGERIVQETRLYDTDSQTTRTMRSKEEAEDYRYFPEPDLPPLQLDNAWLDAIQRELPELPEARLERLQRDYGLPSYDAEVLTSSRTLADYFERAAKTSKNAKSSSNWIMSEVLRLLKEHAIEIETFPVSPESLGELVRLLDDGAISGNTAKDVFQKMFDSGDTAAAIVEREGLSQISDLTALEGMVKEVISTSSSQVAEYRDGKTKVIGWMVGQVMKKSGGKANPGLVKQTFEKLLKAD